MLGEKLPELEGVLEVGDVIGEGTFSTVYKGVFCNKYAVAGVPKALAIKHVTQVVEPHLLENELKFLSMLQGKDNVVRLLFAARHKDSVVFVMPYFEHDKLNKLIRRFKTQDVREYMRKLFTAMAHIHSHNVIHRDIKPNNFLYCIKTKNCALVDFGLAESVREVPTPTCQDTNPHRIPLEDVTVSNINQITERKSLSDRPKKRRSEDTVTSSIKKSRCQCQGKPKVCRDCIGTPAIDAARAGTPGYRPPEVLFKCSEQTTAVDMWACGVILLSMLSGKPNFFNAPDDIAGLQQLVILFGKDAMCKAAESLGKRLIVDLPANGETLSLKEACISLRTAARERGMRTNRRDVITFPDLAYDLLDKLLALVPSQRITAAEALNHPFLKDEDLDDNRVNNISLNLSHDS